MVPTSHLAITSPSLLGFVRAYLWQLERTGAVPDQDDTPELNEPPRKPPTRCFHPHGIGTSAIDCSPSSNSSSSSPARTVSPASDYRRCCISSGVRIRQPLPWSIRSMQSHRCRPLKSQPFP